VIDDLKAQLANNNADLISEFQENITSLEEATEEASWTDWRQSEEIRRLSQPEREVGPNSRNSSRKQDGTPSLQPSGL
jgi:hypothetical protein